MVGNAGDIHVHAQEAAHRHSDLPRDPRGWVLLHRKTGFALRLIDAGKYYFLSRPRRFGKSLFLDTLADLFAGSEALFTGLEAHARWDWSRRFPEVQLSFGAGVVQSRAELERRIRAPLARNASTLGLACSDADDIAGCFAELIEQAHERHGAPVVVLVDEYDKPILDNLTRPEAARDIRDGLRNLPSSRTATRTSASRS